MTWYKFDIWYQYMAGSSMFYHEQGFDEFWQPGGTTAAGMRDGAALAQGQAGRPLPARHRAEPDRGDPFTPVAFLVDYAHGWEPAPFWPNCVQELARATRTGSATATTSRCWRNTSGPPIIRSAARARSR